MRLTRRQIQKSVSTYRYNITNDLWTNIHVHIILLMIHIVIVLNVYTRRRCV